VTIETPQPTEDGAPVPFPLVLGLDTFGDLIYDQDGRPLTHAETIRSLVEQGVLADRVGIDFFGIGEHHTNDFPMPAGDVVLAAIAARTSRIHLGSAVIVLSSDDPETRSKPRLRAGCSCSTRAPGQPGSCRAVWLASSTRVLKSDRRLVLKS
jgi:hypothetical protein